MIVLHIIVESLFKLIKQSSLKIWLTNDDWDMSYWIYYSAV